ncbi:hypothetical protein A2U01_0091672, partial [Trifolium medium]|nr:hypothetical protein [Trifolium medium]
MRLDYHGDEDDETFSRGRKHATGEELYFSKPTMSSQSLTEQQDLQLRFLPFTDLRSI